MSTTTILHSRDEVGSRHNSNSGCWLANQDYVDNEMARLQAEIAERQRGLRQLQTLDTNKLSARGNSNDCLSDSDDRNYDDDAEGSCNSFGS